jgi:hypothetical protein
LTLRATLDNVNIAERDRALGLVARLYELNRAVRLLRREPEQEALGVRARRDRVLRELEELLEREWGQSLDSVLPRLSAEQQLIVVWRTFAAESTEPGSQQQRDLGAVLDDIRTVDHSGAMPTHSAILDRDSYAGIALIVGIAVLAASGAAPLAALAAGESVRQTTIDAVVSTLITTVVAGGAERLAHKQADAHSTRQDPAKRLRIRGLHRTEVDAGERTPGATPDPGSSPSLLMRHQDRVPGTDFDLHPGGEGNPGAAETDLDHDHDER